MRTTVTLDEDVARALDTLRRQEGLATSAALNKLVRLGLTAAGEAKPAAFRQEVSDMGAPRVPIDNIGEALEVLEGEAHR